MKSHIPSTKDEVLDPCDYCLFGKKHQVSFSQTSEKKHNVLNLVYSNVCGPFEVESLGGNRYFLTFIDDVSRKVWVYFLRTKDQIFKYFQEFHVMVERETNKKLRCLHSDNGGEYTFKEFKAYYAKYRIRHEKTVPGTHNTMV
jgi:transposase InsO family protein